MKKLLFLLLLPVFVWGQFNPVAFYEYGASKSGFVSTWKTDNISTGSSTSTQVKLPLVSSGTYNFVVDWGDGNANTITVWNQAQTTHTYSVAGTYTITIKGICYGFSFSGTGDRMKFLSVAKWGSLRVSSSPTSGGFFNGCTNLDLSTVSDVLYCTNVVNATFFFNGCSSLTTINRFNEWDLKGLSSLANFASGCTLFNQNIGSINTTGVLVFASMLKDCINFDNGGSDSIGLFNMSSATNISSIFENCRVFNRDITVWDVHNVVNFANFLRNAWLFNKNISIWNVSSGQDFSLALNVAQKFNQPIGVWNTISATNMDGFIASATDFNQNIGGFKLSSTTSLANFALAKTAANFSTSNLDAIYNGWITYELLPSKTTSFGTIKYTSAGTEGRALLTRANATKTITNAVDNGSGLVRITANTHGLTTNNKVYIKGIVGVTGSNGLFAVTVIDADTIDLQGSSFGGTYTSGGVLRTGYGWSISDGGL